MGLDETKEAQDKSSEETKGTSGKDEETFTKSQVEAEKQKATSDALAAAGRTAKSLEKREGAVTKAEERIAQQHKERDEAELKAAGDDTDKLTAIETRRKERERKAELDERERKLNTIQEEVDGKLDKATKAEIKERAEEVAVKHSVDAKSLIEFTDGSTDKMEELAKMLPKKGEEKTLKVDSSKTIGSGEDLSSLTQVERAGRELKLARQMQKKRRAGEDDIDYKP